MSEAQVLGLHPQTMLAVYADAVARAPHECCGFLSTDGGRARLFPCVNRAGHGAASDAAASTRSFHIDGDELLSLHRHVDDEARAVVVYHSHLEVGAYLSTLDMDAARALGRRVRHLVVDIRGGDCVGARLFSAHISSVSRSPMAIRGTFEMHESHRFNADGRALCFEPAPCDRPVGIAAYNAALLAPDRSTPEAPACPGGGPARRCAEPHGSRG